MISANGGLPAPRYTPQVTPRWPQGSEPASPWQQCFAVSPVDIGKSEDPLTEEELDLVQGYMDQPFSRLGKPA